MSRYRTAFDEPLIADTANFGTWKEAGERTATQRAHEKWKQALADYRPPPGAAACREALEEFIARRTGEGGAPPLT